jgi:hypothetical protein
MSRQLPPTLGENRRVTIKYMIWVKELGEHLYIWEQNKSPLLFRALILHVLTTCDVARMILISMLATGSLLDKVSKDTLQTFFNSLCNRRTFPITHEEFGKGDDWCNFDLYFKKPVLTTEEIALLSPLLLEGPGMDGSVYYIKQQ